MKEERLFDLKQIAEALGQSYESVRKRAEKGLKRKGETPWPVHTTETRQGQPTRLFAYSTLPADVRAAIDRWVRERSIAAMNAQTAAEEEAHRRELETQVAATIGETEARQQRERDAARLRDKSEGQAKFAKLPKDAPKRARAKARQWLVERCWQLQREEKVTALAARVALCERINGGTLAVPGFVAELIPRRHGQRGLREGTLERWMLDYEKGGIWALTDSYGNREGQTLIDTTPALYRLVLGTMIKAPQAGGKQIHVQLQAQRGALAELGVTRLPSERSVNRFRERWIEDNHQHWLLMTSPGKHKNKYQPAFGSQHEAIVRLNQLWEMDSTPGDWLLTDGRHTVVGCIDLYSRRGRLRVSKTSSAQAVGQCFRTAVLAWGVPECVRTDNGQDYVSDYFTTVLYDLEVNQALCLPFASEQKGTVERFLKTVCYGLNSLLPGYIGHNVGEAQDIRARKSFAERIMTPGEVVEVALSSAELQQRLDDWLEDVYHQDPHSGEGMDGLCPVAKAASWAEPIRTVDVRALDALLAPLAGERTVTKKGIRWDHAFYISPILGEYVGETVRCRYDEADLGRLYVYTDDRFLCIAEDPSRTGISRAEVAVVAKVIHRKANAEHKKRLRALDKSLAEDPAAAVIRYRAEQEGKLIAFPPPETPHQTPMLTAGAEAAAARLPRTTPSDTPEQAAARELLAADIARVAENVQRLPEGPADRYRHWLWLQREIKNHAETPFSELGISPEDADWWEHYPNTTEFRSQQRLAEDFPDSYRPRRMGVSTAS